MTRDDVYIYTLLFALLAIQVAFIMLMQGVVLDIRNELEEHEYRITQLTGKL